MTSLRNSISSNGCSSPPSLCYVADSSCILLFRRLSPAQLRAKPAPGIGTRSAFDGTTKTISAMNARRLADNNAEEIFSVPHRKSTPSTSAAASRFGVPREIGQRRNYMNLISLRSLDLSAATRKSSNYRTAPLLLNSPSPRRSPGRTTTANGRVSNSVERTLPRPGLSSCR